MVLLHTKRISPDTILSHPPSEVLLHSKPNYEQEFANSTAALEREHQLRSWQPKMQGKMIETKDIYDMDRFGWS